MVLYVKRWLKAPLQLPDGTLQERDKGTPQGSAVSPVLANLFLHYAFDMFLEREFPTVEFERYADDAVVHCVTERQARQVREALTARLAEVGLELHPDKTKIVYCKDTKRRGSHETVTFTFLGYAFRPRRSWARTGRSSPRSRPRSARRRSRPRATRSAAGGCTCAPGTAWTSSPSDQSDRARAGSTTTAFSAALNPLLRRVNTYLTRWARRKYKRLRGYKRFHDGGPDSSIESPDCSRTGNWTRAFNWKR